MNYEPDPVAIDLICRLTEYISVSLWHDFDDYVTIQYCTSCGAQKRIDDTPVHEENCQGVKLIIEALNYVNT